MKPILPLIALICLLPLSSLAQSKPFADVPVQNAAYSDLNTLLKDGVLPGASNTHQLFVSKGGVATAYQFGQITVTLLQALNNPQASAANRHLVDLFRQRPDAVRALIGLSQQFASTIAQMDQSDYLSFQQETVAELADPHAGEVLRGGNPAYREWIIVDQAGMQLAYYAGGSRRPWRPLTRWEFAPFIALAIPLLSPVGNPLSDWVPEPQRIEFMTVALKTPATQADLDTERQQFQAGLINHPAALTALTQLVRQFELELYLQGVDTDAALARLAALSQQTQPFPDIPKTHWAYAAVQKLHRAGILLGQPDGLLNG